MPSPPGTGTLTRTYDNRFDTLASETGPDGTVTYAYTADGRRQSVTPGGGTAQSTTFDAAGRLTGISQAAGPGSANPAAAQNVTLAYDEADRRTSVTLPNGIQISYAYDDASQLTGIAYRKSDGSTLGDLSYAYDTAGRRIRMGGSLARTTLPEPWPVPPTTPTGSLFGPSPGGGNGGVETQIPCTLIEDVNLGPSGQKICPARDIHQCVYRCPDGRVFSRVITTALACPRDQNPRLPEPTLE